MGRPPLPNGESKDVQIGVRLKPAIGKMLAEAAEDSDESASELLRNAASDYLKTLSWVTCKWTYEQLRDAKVWFPIQLSRGLYEVVGEIFCRAHKNGKMVLKLTYLEVVDIGHGPPQGCMHQITMTQEMVDRIVETGDPKVPFRVSY